MLDVLTPETKKALQREINRAWYQAGYAAASLVKAAADDPVPVYDLHGKLVLSKSGWGMVLVPNALIRGMFKAIHAPGIELPRHTDGTLRGHISVLRPEDIEQIGGPDKISEWGRPFAYQIGQLKAVKPMGWTEMNRCWMIGVNSPAIQNLRKSYGLPPLPVKSGKELGLHITVAIRRKGVLQNNEVSKAAAESSITLLNSKAASSRFFCETCKKEFDTRPLADKCPECSGDPVPDTPDMRAKYDRDYRKKHAGEYCPHCYAMHERGDDGKCNRCGELWPEEKKSDSHTTTHGGQTYDVFKLIDSTRDRPVEHLASHEALGLKGFSRSKRTGFSKSRYEAADTKHPLLVDASNRLLDGRHRLARLFDEKAENVPVRRVTDQDLESAKVAVESSITLLNSKAAAEFAPGIPSKEEYGETDKLPVGKLVTFSKQLHRADRAGPHHDVRIGDENGLISFATKKDLPAPGSSLVSLFRQPLHDSSYAGFEGRIDKGYGKGDVKLVDKGEALITRAEPDRVDFSLAHRKQPERFSVFHPKNYPALTWLAANRTLTEPVKEVKLRHKSTPHTEFKPEEVPEGTVAQPKIDGASAIVHLTKHGPEVLSYRVDSANGRPITHTERVFGQIPKANYGKEWIGSVLRGELYGTKGDKVIPPQALGALLNSTLANSLRKQEREGVNLQTALFDLQRHGDKSIDFKTTPYSARRALLEQILPSLPEGKFHLMEQVEGPEATKQLWDQIRLGKHPKTEEGLVLHRATGKPEKVKLTDDFDRIITGTYPGHGRRAATIGGLTYAHPEEPDKTVGRVGSGFSDELLRQIAEDPQSVVGRYARLKAQQEMDSRALRAPRFLGWHEDYPTRTKVAESSITLLNLGIDKAAISATLQKLKDAKAESDKGNYPKKHQLLRELLAERPHEFKVDSQLSDSIVGLTHSRTGFKIHAPKQILPAMLKSALRIAPGTAASALLVPTRSSNRKSHDRMTMNGPQKQEVPLAPPEEGNAEQILRALATSRRTKRRSRLIRIPTVPQ